jgi:hypothetical protein
MKPDDLLIATGGISAPDLLIATGGISAPLWLPALNQWVALVFGLLSIIYVSWKLWNMYKGK